MHPLAVAFRSGSVEASRLILSHVKGEQSCFMSDASLFLYSMTTNSVTLLHDMMEAKVPVDAINFESDTPLHHVHSGHSPEFIRVIKMLYPFTGRRKTDGRTPLELFLIHMLAEKSRSSASAALGALIEHGDSQQELRSLWGFLPHIIPSNLQCTAEESYCEVCQEHVAQVCLFLLEHGGMEQFEKDTEACGVHVLLSCVRENGSFEANLVGGLIPVLKSAILRSRYWESVKDAPVIRALLKTAIVAKLDEFAAFLLETGVDVNGPVGFPYALELACIPEHSCELGLFQAILEKSDISKLNTVSRDGKELGLIHILASREASEDTLQKLAILLYMGLDVDTRTGKGVPAIIWHLRQRSLVTALWLINCNADLSLTDSHGWDVMHVAAQDNNFEFLKYVVLRRGLTVNWHQSCKASAQHGSFKIKGCNPVHIAASVGAIDCLQFYLDNGHSGLFDEVTPEGFNCLHFAAVKDEPKAIQFIISQKFRHLIHQRSSQGESPLDIAIRFQSIAAIKILLSVGAQEEDISFVITPMLLALKHGNGEIVQMLESTQRRENRSKGLGATTPLEYMQFILEEAIYNDNVETCQRLVDFGCPLNKPILLCEACPLLMHALLLERTKVAELILGSGGDLGIREPLCKSCSNGDRDTGKSVVDIAASSPPLFELLPTLLTKYLQCHEAPFLEDATPLHYAAAAGNLKGLANLFIHIRLHFDIYR